MSSSGKEGPLNQSGPDVLYEVGGISSLVEAMRCPVCRPLSNIKLKFTPGTACPPPDRQRRHSNCVRNLAATFAGRLTRRYIYYSL